MEINEVKELLNQFNESNLTEFDLREGSFELYMNKNQTSRQTVAPAQPEPVTETAAPVPAANTEAESAPTVTSTGEGQVITSPIVGIVYLQPSPEQPFFQGHFPHEPVMPGVLIVEAMAQAGAVALLSMEDFKGKTAYFGGIDKAKFRKKVVPGDTLILEVELTKVRSSAGCGKGIAYVDGKKVAEAELTFMIG